MVLLLLLVPSTEAFTRRRRKGLEGGHGGTPIAIDVSTSSSDARIDANTGSDAEQASPQVHITLVQVSGRFVTGRERDGCAFIFAFSTITCCATFIVPSSAVKPRGGAFSQHRSKRIRIARGMLSVPSLVPPNPSRAQLNLPIRVAT